MKKFTIYLIIYLAIGIGLGLVTSMLFGEDLPKNPLDKMVENIHWLGQAAVKIEALDKLIYCDPYKITPKQTADLILITHKHPDHCSPSDILTLVKDSTKIIGTKDCLEELEGVKKENLISLEPGKTVTIMGIQIEGVPAYNIVKTKFHPKENNWCGYIITIDGIKIYHAGDTERIPEMKTFNCDIALLPLGQTYTMNSVKEAADSALDVGAKIAIPIHYGLYEGKEEDALEFQNLLKGKVKVILKERE